MKESVLLIKSSGQSVFNLERVRAPLTLMRRCYPHCAILNLRWMHAAFTLMILESACDIPLMRDAVIHTEQ